MKPDITHLLREYYEREVQNTSDCPSVPDFEKLDQDSRWKVLAGAILLMSGSLLLFHVAGGIPQDPGVLYSGSTSVLNIITGL